jgi:pimeloyl-ACP methyl ester carboxylesterase
MSSSSAESRAIVKKVYQAFFSPSKYEMKSSDQSVLERGRTERVPFASGALAVTTWGSQVPSILLMHGWGGSRAQMTGFVDPLLRAGYGVVAYDQPAHGDSDGITTNLLEIAPTMDLIAKRTGNFYGIIAHSFGTLITSYVLVERDFPAPARLVYFGAFNRLLDSLPRFQALARLSDEIMAGFREMLDENFGQGVLESITNETLTPQIDIPALMFHDVTDNVTPISDSRAIAQVWKRAKLIETSGLNHRGALQSDAIHEQVVNFLKS